MNEGRRTGDGLSASRCGTARRTADRLREVFGRYAIVFVFGLLTFPLIIDYLWPLWDGRNQTLHDKMVSSVVLDIRPGVEKRPRKVFAVRRGWTVGRAAIVVGAAVVGALAVGRLGVAVNHTVGDSIKDAAHSVRPSASRSSAGGSVCAGPSSCSARPPWPPSLSAGSSFSVNQEETSSRDELFTETFSDEWMFAVGAMMGAAAGALIGGLVFLIWASRRVRKPEAAVDSAAPA